MIVAMVFVAIATLLISAGLTYKIFPDWVLGADGEPMRKDHKSTPLYVVLLLVTLALGFFLIYRMAEAYRVGRVYDATWQSSVP